MSIVGEEELDVILCARLWRDARKSYFEKEGKTTPEDLRPIADAEHDLMKAVFEMEKSSEKILGDNYRMARKYW